MTCFESENQICNNTIGSYSCTCMEGYRHKNEIGQGCEGSFSYHLNIIMILYVSCIAVTKMHHSSLKDLFIIYIDIDECQEPNECSTIENGECMNTQGDYSCRCVAGYEFKNTTQMECIGKHTMNHELQYYNYDLLPKPNMLLSYIYAIVFIHDRYRRMWNGQA